jgi:23S rRNA (pseudouridine1915-N3)-methyltransferase
MKINIIYVGKKSGDFDSKISELKLRIQRFNDIDELRIDHADLKTESEKILKKIESNDYLILLDERGGDLDSISFAGVIDSKMIDGVKRLVFVIGGAYGVSEEIKERANYTLRLSRMVLPHELARLILIEQIYRAFAIINSLPYHHE